ncbi:MAG: hypothetical protein KJT01_00315, partial [Gemmatimonadetes bacterium]|nr:hypothetical protein [Gemmatimonadota bacterium]
MTPQALRREFSAIGLLLAGAFLLGALVFQAPAAGTPCLAGGGPFGPLGTWVRCALVGAVGVPGAVLLAAGVVATALVLFGRLAWMGGGRRALLLGGGVVVLVPVAIALAMGAPPDASPSTGLVGAMVAHYLRKGMGAAGAWLAWLLALSAVTVGALRWNPLRLLVGGARPASQGDAGAPADRRTLAQRLEPDPADLPAIDATLVREALEGQGGTPAPSAAQDARRAAATAPDPRPRARRGRDAQPPSPVPALLDAEDALLVHDEALPPTDLLAAPTPRNLEAGRRELDAAGERLLATLRTFKVDGELVGRTTGPTVTQFEVEPAAGVKVRQIAALADDLALAMRAPSIRIVAPIPGRGAVGVEVPNPTPEMVVLREVLEAPDFRAARAALPVALGKDLEGRPVVADLARMPHLLIAGATGSGKSVCVNTIITSLVYRHTPR